MKESGVYRDFFNSIVASGTRPAYFEIDENFICVTDGYRAYKVLARQFPLNINMMRKLEKAIPIEITEKHMKLKPTKELRDISRLTGGFQVAARFDSGDYSVWVNRKYLERFDNPTLWGTSPLEACIVCEMGKPVGIVLPIRMKD